MNKPQTLGILGGGQLARMLLLSAHPLGLDVAVFAAQGSDPAAQVCGRVALGSMEDRSDLRKFLSPLKAVTFESEFVDTAKLERCIPSGLNVFPGLQVIATIQDRLSQKRLLDRYDIPTSRWWEVSVKKDLSEAEKLFPDGFVLKQRRFGYDGYGTFVFKDGHADAKVLAKSPHGFIAERFVKFKRELATTFVRSRSGFVALPLVESVQVGSRCFSVCGPVTHKGFKKLALLVRRMMDELDYIGVLAVELFDLGDGELSVNELAPRVHNSAHYSQDALTCSQFEYHWRAGLDLPLPPVQQRAKGFAMVNLLGDGGGRAVKLSYAPVGHLHWYGKQDNRKGRKLGHINVLDVTMDKARQKALRWRKDFHL